jgi:polynucleotide 5'-hydroxyl-kinase GRC3/NOL9
LTHPTLPNVAHFIGAITPRSSPAHYLDAAMALIQSYRLDIQTPDVDLADQHESRIFDVIPLVVNTMGWSKGLGADLAQRIEDMLEPTDMLRRWQTNPSPVYMSYSL